MRRSCVVLCWFVAACSSGGGSGMPPDLCAEVSCAPGERCEPETGECVLAAAPVECDPLVEGECELGQKCRPRSGQFLGTCVPAGDKSAGERCDVDIDDCGLGLLCTLEVTGDFCRQLCVSSGADRCPENSRCVDQVDLPGMGSCQPRCNSDADCRGMTRCEVSTGACVAIDCPPDAECSPGETRESRCGNCGTAVQRCGDGCRWGAVEACAGEGECVAGSSEEEACGAGGTRERSCSEQSCVWSEWSDCDGEQGGDRCRAGEMQTRRCGLCGSEQRRCNPDSTWGSWGSCAEQAGECRPGARESCGSCGERVCSDECLWEPCAGGRCQPGDVRSCGLCGVEVCDSQCEWSNTCANERVCRPGTTERCGASCGSAGSRSCERNCEWGSCEGSDNPGECEPGASEACGTCGQRSCEQGCAWGACEGDGSPDALEPNDTPEQATLVAALSDDSEVQQVTGNPTVLPASDVDYYRVPVSDTEDGDAVIRVSLGEQAADFDLCVTYEPDAADHPSRRGGMPESRCAHTVGLGDEEIGWSVETEGDDSGALLIEVRALAGAGACVPYRLEVGF